LTRVVLDIECDSLNPTLIHCVVTKDIDSGQVYTYIGPDFRSFLDASRNYSCVVSHNGTSFDWPVLSGLLGWNYDGQRIDTLILSHLLKYNLEGGHSLDAWGTRLKFPKGSIEDFTTYTPEMLEYCINDVELNYKVYMFLMSKVGGWTNAIECEHEVASILHQDVKVGGYPYDKAKADRLRRHVEERVATLDAAILTSFPPRAISLGEYTPRLTQHGTISRSNLKWYKGDGDAPPDFSVFTADAPLTRLGYEHFNPGSVSQVVHRLTDNGWWEPTERTDGYLEAKRQGNKVKVAKLEKYGWKLNETNLSTLTAEAPDGARVLVERLALNSRLTMLDMWERAYNPSTGSIHGTINSIGTWTHRCSHNNPNLANIATAKTIKYKDPTLARTIIELGGKCRELFHANGHWQVGCDADGIQLRLFAHYANDEALIKANVDGNKELGTDIHTLNKLALGEVCRTRDDAKTWIYAYLLGAGLPKLARILKCSNAEGKAALERLLERYQSIKELRAEVIPRDAARGYFQGLDGRLVVCDSEHLMLAGYLQNGEALVMKHAMVKWRKELKNDVRLLTFVHDEWQTLCMGTEEEAHHVGKLQADSIKWAGEQLGVKCPLKGNYVVGRNWYDTH
jgi:DNA polymerase-1